MKAFGRGREIRTPINGFGDHYSTLKLFPYVKGELIRLLGIIRF